MENPPVHKPIKTFQDLDVYQNLYRAMIIVHTQIVPRLPKDERFDLADQMKRSSKAGPALIAEGFAKRYQKRNWQKYLNDAMGECYETMHHISVCIDIFHAYVDVQLCHAVVDLYDKSCRQLTKLGQIWQNFHEER